MYLLWYNTGIGFYSLVEVESNDIPRYAILSHTWGSDNEELNFHDICNAGGIYRREIDRKTREVHHKPIASRTMATSEREHSIAVAKTKAAHSKLQFCGDKATRDDISYFWIDSCSINKDSSAGLSEALNSMFRWYQQAAKCYVYLSDFSADGHDLAIMTPEEWWSGWMASFRSFKWFTRGWVRTHKTLHSHYDPRVNVMQTVQELVAPKTVEFFTKDGHLIGTKDSLNALLSDITSIPVDALVGRRLLDQFGVQERLSWAAGRRTKREEDSAYSLLGLFGIFMPPIYGEGKEHALKRLHKTIQEAEDKTEKDLLKSLRFDEMMSRWENVKDAHRYTCQWLLNQPEYVRWLDTSRMSHHRGLLWIKGNPGAGKSTLMKFAHRRCQESLRKPDSSSNTEPIAFFFNARGGIIEKTTLGMYRSLLVQLLERPAYLEKIRRSLSFSADVLSETYQWSTSTLQDLFAKAILGVRAPVVCFIDALDECKEQDIRDMLSFVRDLGDRAASSNVVFHVCLASRHYPHISIDRGISLNLDLQNGHTQDIAEYLKTELNIGHSKSAVQLQQDVQDRASGIFMWVVLVVAILNKAYDGDRIHALRRVLLDVPTDLHELFRDILTRDSNNENELLYCVEWILFAAEPMSPEELYYAILSGAEPDADMEWDKDEVSSDDIKRFFLNSSKGLAEITTSESPKVQFIHLSVKDFFLAGEGMHYIRSNMETDFLRTSSQRRLARCCTMYITKGMIARVKRAAKASRAEMAQHSFIREFCRYPLLRYAMKHMPYHAAEAREQVIGLYFDNARIADHHFYTSYPLIAIQSFRTFRGGVGAEAQGEDMDMMFLSSYSSNSRVYYLATYTTRDTKNVRIFFQDETSTKSVTVVPRQNYGPWEYVFSMLELPGHAFLSTARVCSPNTNSAPSGLLPLTWTTERTSDPNLDFYSTKTPEPSREEFDDMCSDFGNVLTVAASEGSVGIVRMLLDFGFDANLQGGYYGNALQAAVVKGSEPTVKLPLEHGANINATGGSYDNALNAATSMGYANIANVLLDNGAKVKVRGGVGRSTGAAGRSGKQKKEGLLEEQMARRWAS